MPLSSADRRSTKYYNIRHISFQEPFLKQEVMREEECKIFAANSVA